MSGPMVDPEAVAPTMLALGVVYASVCTPVDDELTTTWLNDRWPTGISSRWAISTDPMFADGTPNPTPCPDHPDTHRHVLFNC